MDEIAIENLNYLGRRDAFNTTLRHLVSVTSLVEAIEKGAHPADLLHNMLLEGVIKREQLLPIVSLILQERLALPFEARNLSRNIGEFDPIIETFRRWNAIELTCIYHHPNIGVTVINPGNKEHWSDFYNLKKNELMVVYGRSRKNKPQKALKAIRVFYDILAGGRPEEDVDFTDGFEGSKQPQAEKTGPAAAAAPPPKPPHPPRGRMQLTPRYSIQVTNELFHNGNVEAWKNIIDSYQQSHQGNRVIVYHEGELIQDLNSLFKWGKVKHGGLIFFQVAGPSIKNVSRLQKYLTEAASPRFNAFMKRDVNKALVLF